MGYLDCLQLPAATNNTATNIRVHIPYETLTKVYTPINTLGIIQCSNFRKSTNVSLHKWSLIALPLSIGWT